MLERSMRTDCLALLLRIDALKRRATELEAEARGAESQLMRDKFAYEAICCRAQIMRLQTVVA